MSVDTDLEKLRLRIGDTEVSDNGARAVFKDSELEYIIAAEPGDLESQALLAFEAAAAKYARAYDFETDGQAFKRNQQFQAYSKLAADLRKRGVTTTADSSGGITTVDVTRVDGYSDDISNSEVTVDQTNRRRLGFEVDFDVVP